MNNNQTTTVFKPTREFVISVVIRSLQTAGLFGVSENDFYYSLGQVGGDFEKPLRSLGENGNKLKDAIIGVIDATPQLLMNPDGSPVLKNGDVVFNTDQLDLLSQRVAVLEGLYPGLSDIVKELLIQGDFGASYSLPEKMLIYLREVEGWRYMGKDLRTDPNGKEIGAIYRFER